MYHPQLTVFVCAVDCGSFTKAAEKLFISSTAVMKQINSLEARLGLKLIDRTRHGIRLTAAGEVIYKDAKFLFEFSARSVVNARQAAEASDKSFRVGTSLLNPAKPFMDLWYQVNRKFPDYKLQLVPFEDEHQGILGEIGSLGEKFDFLMAVCDSKLWLDKCNMLSLGQCKDMVAMGKEHRLAGKKRLKLSDLYGETLMMVQEGDSERNDAVRRELTRNHPAIRIEDTPHFYDISVFNRCAQTGNLLLTLDCWQDVHPALVSVPVEWDYSVPYGLLYALEPTEEVLRFVEAVREKINGAI